MKNGRLYQNHLFRRRRVLKISYLDGKQLFLSRDAECSKTAIQMENSCFYQKQAFRRCRVLRISYLDGKQLFLSKASVQRCRVLKISYLDGKQLFLIKSRCLGDAECSKSAIQMENSCFYQDQVFRRCRVLKISYLDEKQLFISKLGVQEVQKRITFHEAFTFISEYHQISFLGLS